MNLKTVTITGADDSTDIKDMLELSDKYPFVEWGILFSPKRVGTPRYPSMEWVKKLKDHRTFLRCSAHLCGGYTREMLIGKDELIVNNLYGVLQLFSRFQLNFNSSKTPYIQEDFFCLLDNMGFNFIFQHNDNNSVMCAELMKVFKDISFLYDASGGRGIIADQYQKPFENYFTGYAGGLSPENLNSQLQEISKVTGNAPIWIDTEGKVRTPDDSKLDMEKVEKFLVIASEFINK